MKKNGKEISILKFLLHGFMAGPKIDTMLSLEYVFEVNRMRKKAFGECHRLKGLTRFSEVSPHLLYSSLHPDHAILEPLGHHFIRRLPNENFILHDKNRNKIFVYNTKEYRILSADDLSIPSITEAEEKLQNLWKIFFQTIAIKERKNSRLQMQYMPKKYWQDLVENPN